jgi:ribosome-binding protein aMBF1 (putative translation factor)
MNAEIISRLKQARLTLSMTKVMQARLTRGMSRQDLATACDMDPEVLGFIEKNDGIARPTPEDRTSLARVLGIREDKLFPPRR